MMMTYMDINVTDDIDTIYLKIIWNLREDKHNYDYNPTKKEVFNYIKERINPYDNMKYKLLLKKILKHERTKKLERILK